MPINAIKLQPIYRISLLLLLAILVPLQAQAGSYADSAHGDATYGVNRSAVAGMYVIGNCAHCHEQHASIDGAEPAPSSGGASDYLLLANGFSDKTTNTYSQSDCVCFYCHTAGGSIQSGGISNENYSATFGGAPATTSGIFEAFNQTSYHNLYDLRRYIRGLVGSKSFSDFPAGSNPCSSCHNVHLAKDNRSDPSDPTLTAMSKPSDHYNLFGDDSPGERMSDTTYSNSYQPPAYNGSSNLEPDGLSSIRATQAAKTPDYNEFCTDCHNSTNTIYSTTLGRNLRTIDWDNEKHGKGDADSYIMVDSPYTAGSGSLGYILSCTDCHEPHGSPNAFLIRPSVNGAALAGSVTTFSSSNWSYLCARCHDDSNESIHHLSNDRPYQKAMCSQCHGAGFNVLACTNCHFHGSWVNDPDNANDKTPNYSPTTRTTF